jgi:hypothetical protein
VDFSPSVNRKYKGPMKTRVNTTMTRVRTTRYAIRPPCRFSCALDIRVLVDVVVTCWRRGTRALAVASPAI